MLSPTDLNLLGRLGIAHRRLRRGQAPGERRSPRTARSAEFADFRSYVPGDDFRQIDWRAFARLEKLVLRLYVAEEETNLNVVVDASASMGVGNPPKWPAARRLAAALALLGLAGMDRVAVGVLNRPGGFTPHVRGRAGAGRFMDLLAGLETGGTAGPADLARLTWLRPGLTIVISDFLTDAPWAGVLAGLRQRRQEPLLWQVLAPDEETPTLRGDWKLVEAESAGVRELTVTPALLGEYHEALLEHRDGLRAAAAAADGRFANSLSADDLEAAMLAGLRAGVVRLA